MKKIYVGIDLHKLTQTWVGLADSGKEKIHFFKVKTNKLSIRFKSLIFE